MGNIALVLAQQKRRILYVEGKTDLEILRAWAAVLEHRLLRLLQEPLWKRMAEINWTVCRHFKAMRLHVPDLRGVKLSDRKDWQKAPARKSSPEGLMQLVWRQDEIENYMIHPDAILRWIRMIGDEAAVVRAKDYMQMRFPPALHEAPFADNYFKRKGKGVLDEVCGAALLQVKAGEYNGIARGMHGDEIHPEVVVKLDAIA